MWLLVDIGNTRLKWRWSEGNTLERGGAEPVPPMGHEAALFSRLWAGDMTPARVVISNVAGLHIEDALRVWARTEWGIDPFFISPVRQACGVLNGYQEPQRLGVDRWCALVGARALVDGPACVVDCGTAITLDLLNAAGEHEGGLILPGLRAMIHALGSSTRAIRADLTPAPAGALGLSTADCIRAGVLAAAAGMIEHALARRDFPASGHLLLTGGDAALIHGALLRPARLAPELIFRGLTRLGAGGAVA